MRRSKKLIGSWSYFVKLLSFFGSNFSFNYYCRPIVRVINSIFRGPLVKSIIKIIMIYRANFVRNFIVIYQLLCGCESNKISIFVCNIVFKIPSNKAVLIFSIQIFYHIVSHISGNSFWIQRGCVKNPNPSKGSKNYIISNSFMFGQIVTNRV